MNISWLISVVLVRLVEVLVVGVDPGAALDVLPVPLKVLVLLGAELVDLKMENFGVRLSDPPKAVSSKALSNNQIFKYLVEA